MPSLDTNVLLRWLLRDVPAQTERADELIGSGASWRVDDAALIKTVYVLESVMKVTRPTVRKTIQLVIATGSLEVDRGLWQEIGDELVAHPRLSVVEIYLALRARATDTAPLRTFDRKLASQLDDVELV